MEISGKSATVKFFDDQKGFGYVVVPGLGDAYVHRRALPGEGYRTLVTDEPVVVDVTEGERGLQVAAVHRPSQRRSGTVVSFDFAKGFGKISDFEAGDEVFVHYSNILSASGKAELIVGERVDFFRKPTERGDQAIYVKRLDARHPWERFAHVPPDAYQRLAGLAESEDWTLEAEDSTATSGRLPILESYVRYTFARVEEQEKVAQGVNADSHRVAAFNTGLVTPNQEEIYGLFIEAERDEAHEWRFVSWVKASDNRVSGAFENRPRVAQYWDDPECLFYDVRRPLILDWDHFVEDNLHRYPEGFRDNPSLARAATMAAVEMAKQRVARNYKTAVPQFHRGETQLLLPLSIDGSGRAQLALVVRPVGNEYVGETVLPLAMAIKNARLLARPDRDWLQP